MYDVVHIACTKSTRGKLCLLQAAVAHLRDESIDSMHPPLFIESMQCKAVMFDSLFVRHISIQQKQCHDVATKMRVCNKICIIIN